MMSGEPDPDRPPSGAAPPRGTLPRFRPPRQLAPRLKLGFVVALIAAVVILNFTIGVLGPGVAFVLGGALVVGGFWLLSQGRAGIGPGFAVLLSGLAVASIGVALQLTHVKLAPNPLVEDPAVYYAPWLQIENRRLRPQLRGGERVDLAFEPRSRNVLRLESSGMTDARRGEIAARVRADFTGNYPGKPFEIRAAPAGAGPP